MNYFISLKNINKAYSAQSKLVLENINLNLSLSTSISILGKSGCGKSTLLYILGLLDKPSSGQYYFNNMNILELNHTKKSAFRNQYFGFIFQNHQLIPYLSAIENIRLPYIYRKNKVDIVWEKYVLTRLEIVDLVSRYPYQLSLGQQQRVAIARGLITQAKVILADEPTASLDSDLAEVYMNMMLDYVEEKKALYIMVTHDKALAQQTKLQFYL